MKNPIIYQMALRSFTPEGTLKAAEALLSHVASLGVDIVYVCPMFKEDDDEDRATWSGRQKASGTDNPKNPYKIADYFSVDEEYGTKEDLKAFVQTAHKMGLLVMFDLVYLHCGQKAVFLSEHPDFVIREEDGTIKKGENWPFARLNFESRALRDYLIGHMETLVREYDADGFRCDVGECVPLDFWREAFDRVKALKKDLITLDEGSNAQYIDGTFDLSYDFGFSGLLRKLFAGEAPASDLKLLEQKERAHYGSNVHKLIRTIDNHDIASDSGVNRNEITMTGRGVEAALCVTNTFSGVPFLWNGYEFADNAENCMFSNRFHGRRSSINWSRAFTEEGKRRLSWLQKLHALRHAHRSLEEGDLHWVDNDAPQQVISYIRECPTEKTLVVVNAKNKAVDVLLDGACATGKTLFDYGAEMDKKRIRLAPYGYLILEL